MLAAYREAELQGAVQVRVPEAAAPQACTAQAAVRTRPRGGSGVEGAAGPGMQGSRAARLVHPAPQLLPGRPPASGAAQQSQPRGAATRGRRNAADSAPSESSARSSHAPRPRRATVRPSAALRLLGTRSPPPIREKCRRGSDQSADQPRSRRQGARPNLRAAAELSFSSLVLVSLTISSKVSLS
ncbi:hypothetical protein LEMLEM_LOCUS24688 [Lemmus lemmus]